MKRAIRMLIVVPVAAAVAACDTGTAGPVVDDLVWVGTLQGEAGWEHLSGEAEVLWRTGAPSFLTAALITGDEPGAVRPWHVHHNTCAEGGGIVGADGDYERLVIGADGSATVVSQVPTPMDATANFHVNVHLSEDEMEVVIACGDLELIAGG